MIESPILVVTDERISKGIDGTIWCRTAPTGALTDLIRSAKGHITILARPWRQTGGHALEGSHNVQIIELPDWTAVTAPFTLAQIAKSVRIQLVKKDQLVVAFGPGIAAIAAAVPLRTQARRGAPFKSIVLLRTDPSTSIPAHFPRIVRPFTTVLARLFMEFHSLSNTSYSKRVYVSRHLRKKWRDNSRLIAPEIDWSALGAATLPNKKKTREEPIKVLYVGRLAREKGPDIALSAFLGSGIQRAELEIAGEGPMRHELERMVEHSHSANKHAVRFLGSVTHEAALATMRDADIVLVPSRSEAFGLVAFEALWCGCRVLHSGVGGLTEATSGAHTCTEVSELDPSAWSAAIREAVRTTPTSDTYAKRTTTNEPQSIPATWSRLDDIGAELIRRAEPRQSASSASQADY